MSSSDGRPDRGDRDTGDAEKSTTSGRSFRSVTLTPQRVQAEAAETRLDDEEFTERILFLDETAGGVTIATEGAGDGKTGGSLAELDVDQARRLADALQLAADQIEEADAQAGDANE